MHSIVIEKPFGRDYKSAHELNAAIHRFYPENQIFRSDHYLAKEAVQNILIFRFANSIFEASWNSNYIESIQINAFESIGVEDAGRILSTRPDQSGTWSRTIFFRCFVL